MRRFVRSCLLIAFAPLGPAGTELAAQIPAPPFITWDFETGDLRGWELSGNAFRFQPTLDDNPIRRESRTSAHQGRYWIGTFERYQGGPEMRPGDHQGDTPQGTLTSRRFRIPDGRLSFLVGGGESSATRVELVVLYDSNEEVVVSASGMNAETMRRVEFNVSEFAGQPGFIRIVDASSDGWGHINADDFRWSAWATRTPNLLGRNPEIAAEILAESGLWLGSVREVATEEPPGTIVAQDPEPGAPTFGGHAVRVELSVGAEPQGELVEVPTVLHRSEDEAHEILVGRELRLGTIERLPSTEPAGRIIEQDPRPGTRVRPGESVAVVIVDPQLVEVPNLLERPLRAAERLLNASGLALRPSAIETNDAPRGTVLNQDPAPGELVPLGSAVAVTFAAQPPPTGRFPWIPVIGGSALALAALLSLFRLRRGRKLGGPPPKLDVRVARQPGTSEVESAGDLIDIEVGLRTRADTAPDSEIIGASILKEQARRGET